MLITAIRFETSQSDRSTLQSKAQPTGSALAPIVETVRAELNQATVAPFVGTTRSDSPTSKQVGVSSLKVGITSSWGFSGGFMGAFFGVASSVLFALSAAVPNSYAHDHGRNHGHGRHYGGGHGHHPSHDRDQGKRCVRPFDVDLHASQINGGNHLSFDLRPLKWIELPEYKIKNVLLSLTVQGKGSDLKKLKMAINGVRAVGKQNRDFYELAKEFLSRFDKDQPRWQSWLISHGWNKYRHWRCDRDDDYYNGKNPLATTIDLTWLLINAQGEFLPLFERLIEKRGTLVVSLTGSVKILSATITVRGDQIVKCTGEPGPQPTPSPTPTPTPTPGATPGPTPSPTPTAEPTPNPTPSPTPEPTPVPVAPKTFVDSVSPSAAVTRSTTMSIAFSSDQTQVSYSCSLDGAVAELCSSPKLYSGLESGMHTVVVRAMNAAGLSDEEGASHSWMVDTIAPDVQIVGVEPAGSVTNSSSIELSFESLEASEFQCSIDGKGYLPCSSPMTFTGLAEGVHEVDVISVDAVGNTSLAPARYQWLIDQTAPSVMIVGVDPSAMTTNRQDATFTLAASESATFECSLDGEKYQSCASPFNVSNLAEGQHLFRTRAVDVAGNVGSAAEITWAVDLTAPQIIVGNIVPDAGRTNAHAISMDFSASETSTFYCSFDDEPLLPCLSPYTRQVTEEGEHSLLVSAVDMAGNASQTLTAAWTMDYSTPQISFGIMTPSAAAHIKSSELTVEVNATEPVFYSALFDGQVLTDATSPLGLTGLAEGGHTLELTAADEAGNLANTITHNFTVDMTAPVVTIESSDVGTMTNQTSNVIAFSTSEQGSFECNFNGSGFTPCSSPYSVSGLIDGTHVFQARATDLAGNVSASATLSWVVDLTAPVTSILSATPGAAVTNSTALSVSFTADDQQAAYECSVDGSAFTPCLSPYAASGLADGAHSVQVRATDLAGNVELAPATHTVIVDTLAPITSIAVLSAGRTTTVTLLLSSNEPGSIFSCSLDGSAFASCENTISFDSLADGSHTLLARATDVAGNTDSVGASQVFNYGAALTTYILNVAPAQTFTNQRSITISFAANRPGATFMCALDSGAAAECISPMTYSNLSNGNHSFVVRATHDSTTDETGARHDWAIDSVIPTVASVTVTVTSQSATISWTTSEPASTQLFWGLGTDTSNVTTEDPAYTSSHTVTLTGLSPNTVYSYRPVGHDPAGNSMVGSRRNLRTNP